MEKTINHSKSKLALAVVTSPVPAFEEITRRRLLGTAFFIVALTGLAAFVGGIGRANAIGPVQWFALAKDNPLTWVGLYMLYALALKRLLNWLGTEIDYTSILLVLGWSHIILLVHQISGAIWSFMSDGGMPVYLAQTLGAFRLALPIMYLFVVGKGIQIVSGTTLSRGIVAYFVIAAAAVIAFDITYGQARTTPFKDALSGIGMTALRLTTITPDPWLSSPDQIPRFAAAVVGLILGLWTLLKSMDWDKTAIKKVVVGVGLIGALLWGSYVFTVYKFDYHGKLLEAQRLYDRDKFTLAAEKLESLLPIVKNNVQLVYDVANVSYLSGNDANALKYYNHFVETVNKSKASKKDKEEANAAAYSGIGSVYDAQGKSDKAIEQFEKAKKAWPEFKEPWIRLAVTYDRAGEYDKAIDAGNHAVKKLESDAVIVWVALLEGFAQTGDQKQAKAAYAMIAGKDSDLASKIGSKPEDWKNAVDKLTRSDLRYPMEQYPVYRQQPEAGKRAPAQKNKLK